MLSGSFKCFFAVTGLDLGPIGLVLLPLIYGKVAICKSCDTPAFRQSRFRLSTGNRCFDTGAAQTPGTSVVTIDMVFRTDILMFLGVGKSRFLVSRFPIKYPPNGQIMGLLQ